MKQARAVSKYIRISPTKVRRAVGMLRGMSVEQAALQLQYSEVKGGRLLKKTLDSAVANAERVADARREDLKVLEVRVDEGPRLKRSKPKNRGGQHPFQKRMSHFTVVVGAVEGV